MRVGIALCKAFAQPDTEPSRSHVLKALQRETSSGIFLNTTGRGVRLLGSCQDLPSCRKGKVLFNRTIFYSVGIHLSVGPLFGDRGDRDRVKHWNLPWPLYLECFHAKSEQMIRRTPEWEAAVASLLHHHE